MVDSVYTQVQLSTDKEVSQATLDTPYPANGLLRQW